MQITPFSLLMSVIWSSALAIFNYFCRKKHFFIRQVGITNILFLYLFSIVRMMIPYEFSFTRIIPSGKAFSNLCRDTSIHKIGANQISLFSVLSAIWLIVSATLIIRFFYQYVKTSRELSAYSIRGDEQCQRMINRILNTDRKQLNIDVRRSEQIDIPMGAGIFRKSIFLPNEEYSASQLYYILRHEYTHFKNEDLIIKVLIHIYWCIFWWNPVIYLIKRDLAQILEIKCDLDVTANMDSLEKAQYLTTIVTMLKNAGAKKSALAFFGTTAFVSKKHNSQTIERFKIVSNSDGCKRKNFLFSGSWFLIFTMLIFLSYSFVIRPDYEIPLDGGATNAVMSDNTIGSRYTVKCVGDIYYVYFRTN